MHYFADIILPLGLDKPFTYALEEVDYNRLTPGYRVAVSFGKFKIYTGIVIRLHQVAPQNYDAKFIEMVLDDIPTVTKEQLQFWNWLSKYYHSRMGDILRTAIPTTLLLESETLVIKKSLPKGIQEPVLSDDEFLVYDALDTKALSINDISKILNRKNVLGLLQEMFLKEYVDIHQKLTEKYIPKKVRYIRVASKFIESDELNNLFELLKNAPKQKEVMLSVFEGNPTGESWKNALHLINQTGSNSTVLRTLITKGYLEESHLQEDRVLYTFDKTDKEYLLSPAQKIALDVIKEELVTKEVVLFQGITGSGKTEVYMELIAEILAKGDQVLYLLPEISLTPQMVQRLQERFGKRVAVYHSKFSIHERTEVWQNILSNNENARVVVGARSSLFLPFKNLRLIIVDEEHEVSFKQFDPSPRYHARDSSIVLASFHNAKVILGSATPSIETSFNSTTGKYGWVKLNERYGGVALPEIGTVDLKEAYRKKQMKGVFSQNLLEEISNTLKDGKQIILFQNRRGYAPVHECIDCGNMPQCNQCDVTLTYHQYSEKLKCHYCGYHVPKPTQCHACGMTNLATKGVGTQQIQEQVEQFFPGVKVGRMDWDSTRGKWDFDKLINSFIAQETKILVGTQMVVKGLDFKHVRLVGVLNADHLLNFPDFRAHERTYQMLSQVAGRAGRKSERGKVIIQTYQPKHPIIKQVKENDYEGMLKDQLRERKQYRYPPYYRLIRIVIKHKDLETVKLASKWIFNVLNQSYSGQILGPIFPNIARLRNYYQMQLLIKVENDTSRKVIKQLISQTLKSFDAIGKFKSTRINVDVDPY